MSRASVKSFYEIQKEQKAKSLALFVILILFYAAAFGLAFLAVDFGFGAFLGRPSLIRGGSVPGILGFAAGIALLVALLSLYDARRNGAPFILKRLAASPPDLGDRYHGEFANVLDEVRIAAGLSPGIRPYVLPDHVVNSLALVEPDGVPCVVVTEGMLAELTREELQAVAAHELAHVVRGDTFFLTLVCSLADVFDRIRDALHPDADDPGDIFAESPRHGRRSSRGKVSAPAALLLSRLFCREREILADAAAVEICRDPAALARAIVKAHIRNSFVGDFERTYAPLFIVAPRSNETDDDENGRTWAGTHPPLAQRIEILARMAALKPEDIFRQVWEGRGLRESARTIRRSFEESHPGQFPCDEATGPETLFDNRRKNACPRCGIPLSRDFYEGVPIQTCSSCTGRLVGEDCMGRILDRTEIGFSEDLRRKAAAFRERFLKNPIKKARMDDGRTGRPACPSCGTPMRDRPFNYQYFVPVDKCFACSKIWFDADELEILQILIEEAKARPDQAV